MLRPFLQHGGDVSFDRPNDHGHASFDDPCFFKRNVREGRSQVPLMIE